MKTIPVLLTLTCIGALTTVTMRAEVSAKKPEATNGSSAAATSQGSNKGGEKSGTARAPSGAAPEITGASSDPDLNPVFPPNRTPGNPLHFTPKTIGNGLVRKSPTGALVPVAPMPTAVTNKSNIKPTGTPKAGPMAASEIGATKTAFKPQTAPMAKGEAAATQKTAFPQPAHPMADAELAGLHKSMNPEGNVGAVKKEGELPVAKLPESPKTESKMETRSVLTGTVTVPARGKAPPLASLGGLQGSKTVKHTAGINGTTLR
jgi:hypothetical protein